MKRFIQTVAIFLLCGALAVPVADAQGRGRSNQSGSQRTHQSANGSNNGGSRSDRPVNRPGNSGQRPGNNGNGQGQRPGGNQGQQRPNNQRPGNNQGHQRPSGSGGYNGGSYSHRPGGYQPDHHPHGGGYHPGGHHHGPSRPHMRPHRPFYRPTPPPSWHASRSWRPFRSILGITLGTAFNISINQLIHNGYVINSYGDNMIFVGDVVMLNMMWPDAILFYNNIGALCGSRFVYSTAGYNMNRYNMTYTSLVSTYGMPISVQNVANGVEATWWGTQNQFIRLSYTADYANNGSLRYYTSLSFGNY